MKVDDICKCGIRLAFGQLRIRFSTASVCVCVSVYLVFTFAQSSFFVRVAIIASSLLRFLLSQLLLHVFVDVIVAAKFNYCFESYFERTNYEITFIASVNGENFKIFIWLYKCVCVFVCACMCLRLYMCYRLCLRSVTVTIN